VVPGRIAPQSKESEYFLGWVVKIQIFSGIYLKPLDDAFDVMEVTYLRYQDDLLILCNTNRLLQRARQRMIHVLHERQLTLSRKKTRIGSIERGFHFLGIPYQGTQTPDNTNVAQDIDKTVIPVNVVQYNDSLSMCRVDVATNDQIPGLNRMVPHPRTLRKAREQVKQMVNDGVSPKRIRSYLDRWTAWWVRASEHWQYRELLGWFLNVCWDFNPTAYAAGLLDQHLKKSKNPVYAPAPSASGFQAIA
jgi:hypothetical protein